MYESAKRCSTITKLWTKPPSSTRIEDDDSLRLCSQKTATDSVSSLNYLQKENPVPIPGVSGTSTDNSNLISSLNDHQKENPVPKPGVSGISTAYSDSISSQNDIHNENLISNSNISGTSAAYSATDPTLALESSCEQNTFPPCLLQSEIELQTEELSPSVPDDTIDYFKRPSENDLSDFFLTILANQRKKICLFQRKNQYSPSNKATAFLSIDSGYPTMKQIKNCIVSFAWSIAG